MAAILNSGVHATIAGVVLAFMVSSRAAIAKESFDPMVSASLEEFRSAMREGDDSRADACLGAIEAQATATDPPIERLTRGLHPWVGFVVLPLFALANSGVELSPAAVQQAVASPVLWGVVAGLVLGKPLRIVAFTWIFAKAGVAELSAKTSFGQLLGVGMLAGIGFMVAIFIAALAFHQDQATVNVAKMAILAASVLAGLLGFLVLKWSPDASAQRT